ncbi:hypothetical protein REJC140_02549 [Pseudorhizobium endolithicum]|uniref:Uncharacterized protein n=1 Tax=Pseudorhizobium endolithicum TaxID=1191678 RepID=A0ABM8PG53_9HYPH|nr:hypothetical protein [Pseudorhizobium endolithicum]CAD6421533.1 hypothetical protein REQ54_02242 [Rhizobium sp. Q54]CAD7027820.1 hypothetical protein REJC140_02549 [Pseudorhizobium endolithicum]
MSNVLEFKRPPTPPEPKKPNPRLRRLLTVLGIAAALVLVWAYFQYVGGEAP